MKLTFGLLVTITSSLCVSALELPVTPGPFTGTRDSLTNYSGPDWFRDAKFGIWAHWGPQSVPMEGDWYARKMYQQGTPQYNDHLARYGHPSTNGWKDIIPLWHAEKWEPEKLMALYKKAGAKYFVSMGTHHDDFFSVELAVAQMECRQHGAASRCRGRLAEGGKAKRLTLRRLGTFGREL